MNTLSHTLWWSVLGQPLNRWMQAMAASWAEARAQARLRQAARIDHRVLAECLQAGGRDLDDEAGLAQSWGRFPEALPDGRGTATHLRHC